MYTNVNQHFLRQKKYRNAYFISISVSPLPERETGLNKETSRHGFASRDRSSRLDFDARTKKDHPTDDPFSFERETGLEVPNSSLQKSVLLRK